MNECCRKYSIRRTSFASQLSGFCSNCIQCASSLYSYYLAYLCRLLSPCPGYMETWCYFGTLTASFRIVSCWFKGAVSRWPVFTLFEISCTSMQPLDTNEHYSVLYRNPDLGRECLCINFTTRELIKHHQIREVDLKIPLVSFLARLRNQLSVLTITEQELILLFFLTQFIFYKRDI